MLRPKQSAASQCMLDPDRSSHLTETKQVDCMLLAVRVLETQHRWERPGVTNLVPDGVESQLQHRASGTGGRLISH